MDHGNNHQIKSFKIFFLIVWVCALKNELIRVQNLVIYLVTNKKCSMEVYAVVFLNGSSGFCWDSWAPTTPNHQKTLKVSPLNFHPPGPFAKKHVMLWPLGRPGRTARRGEWWPFPWPFRFEETLQKPRSHRMQSPVTRKLPPKFWWKETAGNVCQVFRCYKRKLPMKP